MTESKGVPAVSPVRNFQRAANVALYSSLFLLGALAVGSIVPGRKILFTPIDWPLNPILVWVGLAVLTVVILASSAYNANGRWIGFLIDERNRTSLSRLQIGMWTVIALSAFLTIAFARSGPNALGPLPPDCTEAASADKDAKLATWKPGPLQIQFPAELLVALGISAASFAGSSLIKSSKRAKQPVLIADLNARKVNTATAFQKAQTEFNAVDAKYKEKLRAFMTAKPENTKKTPEQAAQEDLAVEKLSAERKIAKKELETAEKAKSEAEEAAAKAEIKVGTLKVNDSPADATLGDMFQGNEVGNYNLIDLSKVQMFFFTIAIGVAYSAALINLLTSGNGVILEACGVALPPFNDSMNALLGLSHAGYIATQSVDHTKTT